jgi:hypothetical protein
MGSNPLEIMVLAKNFLVPIPRDDIAVDKVLFNRIVSSYDIMEADLSQKSALWELLAVYLLANQLPRPA